MKRLLTLQTGLRKLIRYFFPILIVAAILTSSITEAVNDSLQLRRLFGMPSVPTTTALEEKGWLGVFLEEGKPVRDLDAIRIKFHSAAAVPVLIITGVFPGSPAEVAGLLAGDKILAMDDEILLHEDRLSLSESFSKAIATISTGERICLHILRNEKMRKIFVTLLPRPMVEALSKKHPDFETDDEQNKTSQLYRTLESRGLLDEYNRTAGEIWDRASYVISPVIKDEDYNPFRLKEINFILKHPMDLPLVAEKLTASLGAHFSQERSSFSGLINEGMDELDFKTVEIETRKEPVAGIAELLDLILTALAEASKARAEALSNLTAGDIENIYRASIVFASLGTVNDELEKILNLALKVDLPALMEASMKVARVLDIQLAQMPYDLSEIDFPAGWVIEKGPNLIRVQTANGKVLLGGNGNNVYREDALLIIDLGGDDIYLNNAGASSGEFPFSVVIDFSGDDLYRSSKNFSQGSGFLGGGFLIDYAGNDRYISERYSQGSGFFGAGLLADLGGHDQYICHAFCQASGIFGTGLLAEAEGNDDYYAAIFSQGIGLTKGYGALVEAGGDDNYYASGVYPDHRQPDKAFKSLSQGFGYGLRPSGADAGTSGGIGIIADAEGDDTYIGDYFAQGSSYWYALGILSDQNGDDIYFAGRYSQGAGIHHSAGILADANGDDEYFVHYGVSQGCGHDLAIGFLLDNGGNDKYVGGILSQGAGHGNGIGVLNDNGGRDEYSFREPGQGSGHFLQFRNLGSFGVFFDTGGGDDFYRDGEKNDRMIFKNQWGIFADTR